MGLLNWMIQMMNVKVAHLNLLESILGKLFSFFFCGRQFIVCLNHL